MDQSLIELEARLSVLSMVVGLVAQKAGVIDEAVAMLESLEETTEVDFLFSTHADEMRETYKQQRRLVAAALKTYSERTAGLK